MRKKEEIKELTKRIERIEEKIEYLKHKEDKAVLRRKVGVFISGIEIKAIIEYPNVFEEKVEEIIFDTETIYPHELQPTYEIKKETQFYIYITKKYSGQVYDNDLIKIDKQTGSISRITFRSIEEMQDCIKGEKNDNRKIRSNTKNKNSN